MKNSTLYIIGAIVLLAVVALFVFRKKGNTTTADAAGGNLLTGGNYGLGSLLNTNPVGYTGSLQGIGETNYNFIMRRQAEGWRF